MMVTTNFSISAIFFHRPFLCLHILFYHCCSKALVERQNQEQNPMPAVCRFSSLLVHKDNNTTNNCNLNSLGDETRCLAATSKASVQKGSTTKTVRRRGRGRGRDREDIEGDKGLDFGVGWEEDGKWRWEGAEDGGLRLRVGSWWLVGMMKASWEWSDRWGVMTTLARCGAVEALLRCDSGHD
ncbi:hypothetical protein SESBI_35873 [Sesbania bispinosa]|nr:hypothetical protein SESBI_35873 [Sesbania bispinosa]